MPQAEVECGTWLPIEDLLDKCIVTVAPCYAARSGRVVTPYQLNARDAFDLARPRLGVAAVMSALPLMIPLVIVLMRKLRTAEVQL